MEPDAAAPRMPTRVLAIHPGALGDVLQAVPALRALALAGGAAVTFAGQPRLGRLLVGLGATADAVDFDGLGLDGLFVDGGDDARARAHLARFARVVSWFGARHPPYPERLRALAPGAVLAAPVPPEADDAPVWQHLLRSIAAGDAPAPSRQPLAVPDAWRRRGRDLLAGLGADPAGRALLVHPGAGGRWKRWPPARFCAVVDAVGREAPEPVVVHEGPADAEAAGALLAALGRRAVRLVQPDLGDLAGVLASCAGYLGGDSGVSHVAAAVGVPAVIVYPPETAGRWAPWSPTARPVGAAATEADVTAALSAALRREA